MKLAIKVEGLEEVERRLGGMNVTGALRTAMKKSVIFVENMVVRFTPTDTSRLVDSIGWRVEGLGSDIRGIVGSNVRGIGSQQVYYLPFVEHDTAPHWPPILAVTTWAERHGMAAFAVARSIARKGTRGYKMFQRGAEASASKIQEFFDRAIADLVRRA